MQRLAAQTWVLDSIKQEAVPGNGGKVRESREIVEERLWKEFFQDPSLWWDTRRNKKKTPSYPDFKHAAKGHSLWIDSWYRPEWVATKLESLEVPPSPSEGRGTRARYKDDASVEITMMHHEETANNILDSTLEPLATYERVRLSGSGLSVPVIVSALKACTSTKNLQAGKTIHEHVSQTRDLLSNKFVSSTLVGFYAKCGSMEDARKVFEGTTEKDIVLWNSMILGYANCGKGKEGLETFHRMLDEGYKQDHITFLAALKSCLSLIDKVTASSTVKAYLLEVVKGLHAQARKTGNEEHTHLENSLVDLYAKCGSILDARRTFDNIQKKSLVSWTTMISAYAQKGDGEAALELYRKMLDKGFEPDALTFVAALKACSRVAENADKSKLDECLSIGKNIHDQIVKAGFEQHAYVASSLLDMYSKCGSLIDARNVFELMKNRGVVSWTSIIMGYAENGEADTALEMFSRMQESGVAADGVTYVAALKACSSLAESEAKENWTKLDCLNKVREIHTQARAASSELHLFVASALVDSYAKCGSIPDARNVFDAMKSHNVVSWTGIIQGHAENGEGEKALELFARMRKEGCCPDAVTFVAAFRACIAMTSEDPQGEPRAHKVSPLKRGKNLHFQVIKAGFEQNKLVEHVVVEMYCSCGAMNHARRLFEDLKDLRVHAAPWNYMILNYAESGNRTMALEIYKQMLEQSCSPDAVTYAALLKLCAAEVALGTGKRVLAEIFNSGFHKKAVVMNSAIDFYGKCGSLSDAERVFEWMERRDVVTWNSLLDVYSRCGDAGAALEVLERMKECGHVAPNGVTYLIALTVCSHAGLVDQGMRYFEEMEEESIGVKHYTCLVDMLGRANRLGEALEVINKSNQADGVMWKALLDAARKWKDEEIGKIAFDNVTRFDNHGSLAAPYVLVTSTYI